MRNEACDRLKETIAALAAGRFDELTPAAADEACAHLDACAACAAVVERAAAQPGAEFAPQRLPTHAEWDGVWAQIDAQHRAVVADVRDDSGGDARGAGHGGARAMTHDASREEAGATLRLVRAGRRVRPVVRWGVTGIAAAILLAVGVLLMLPTQQSLALAHESEVSIESLEVYGDGTPMVVCVNQHDGDDVAVIWVVEDSDQ